MTAGARAALLAMASGLLGLPLAAAAATNAEAELARCAAIAAADARLGCYDVLAGRAADGHAPAPDRAVAVSAPPVSTPPVSTPAASMAAAPPALLPTAPAAAAPPDPEAAAKNFGLSAAQMHTADQGPKAIEAHVVHVIVNQSQRGYLVLDNGQTWAILDGEMMLDAGDAVTISRAALRSFMLTSASHHSYHVRRLR